jgi:hypothetical protein
MIFSFVANVIVFTVFEKLFKEYWVIVDTFRKTKNIFMNIVETNPNEIYVIS